MEWGLVLIFFWGDLCHITKTAISVGDDLYPNLLGDVNHNGTSIPTPEKWMKTLVFPVSIVMVVPHEKIGG